MAYVLIGVSETRLEARPELNGERPVRRPELNGCVRSMVALLSLVLYLKSYSASSPAIAMRRVRVRRSSEHLSSALS